MPHDFKNFPELTLGQMEFYYVDSPHKQITEDIKATVIRVADGDTVIVDWEERDFSFPIRLADLAAPEMNQEGGKESQSWLEEQVLDKEVEVILSKQRVEKWGRILADIQLDGMSMSDESAQQGFGVPWEERETTDPFPDMDKELDRFNK